MWNNTGLFKLWLAIFSLIFVAEKIGAGDTASGFRYRMGLHNNLIIDQTDFKSDYTGTGISAEFIWRGRYSVYAFISPFKIYTAKSGEIKTGCKKINLSEASIALRARINDGAIRVFPQIGIGGWGWIAGNYYFGAGAEFNPSSILFITVDANYLIVDSDLFISTNRGDSSSLGNKKSGWTSSMFRIGLNIVYQLF
jgi:hypothetical protein